MSLHFNGAAFAAALFSLAAFAPAEAQTRRAHTDASVETLAAANAAARHRPRVDGFVQARQVYAYEAGAIYEVYAHPGYVSTILLEPGETLVEIAAGDTSRWMVTQAETETAEDPRTIVLVKPSASALRTNIVLITDRRSYLIEAIAGSNAVYSAQVAWSYPNANRVLGPAPDDVLNVNYHVRVMRGARPIWIPARVYDDGRRTWIEFSPEVGASDLPPLFAVTAEGLELINYRTQEGALGRRYMVDRVFEVAELRLGVRSPTIVRIERTRARQRPQSRHGARP